MILGGLRDKNYKFRCIYVPTRLDILPVTQHLQLHGVIHQTTCPYSPQQNEVDERKNRHLLEMVRAMLFEANMPLQYWGESLSTASYLINRIPSCSLDFHTPLKTLNQNLNLPPVPNLPPKVFGCTTFVQLPHHTRHKLQPRAIRCVVIGYGLRKDIGATTHQLAKCMFLLMSNSMNIGCFFLLPLLQVRGREVLSSPP